MNVYRQTLPGLLMLSFLREYRILLFSMVKEGRLQERFVIPGCQLQRCLITRLFNLLLEIRAIPSVIVRRHNV